MAASNRRVVLAIALTASTTFVVIHHSAPAVPAASKNGEENKPPERRDAWGDPLPKNAIARLGTLRFRGCRGPLVFSPDGKHIVSAGGNGGTRAVFWDRARGRRVKEFAMKEDITRLVFSPDGKKLAAVGNGGCFNPVWDMNTGKQLFTFTGQEVAFRAGGKELISTYASWNQTTVRTLDAGTGRPLTEWGLSFLTAGQSFPLSPNGRFIAFEGSPQAKGCELVLFDLAKRAEIKKLRFPQNRIHPIHFSDDGQRLIICGDDGGFSVWDWSSGKELYRWKGVVRGPAAFSPDGRRLAWIGVDENQVFSLWTADVDAGKSRRLRALMFDKSYGNYTSVFSPDGKSIALVSEGNALVLFDSRTGRDQLPLAAHEGRVWNVEYSPDGRHVMTRDSYRLLVWEAATGRLLRRLPDDLPEGETILLNTLSRGRIVTVTLADGSFHLRDAATAKELRRLMGKDGYYADAVGDVSAVSADDHYAAILGPAGIRIYDLDTGAIRCQFSRDYPVWGMNFTEDDRILEVTEQQFRKGLLPRFYDARTGREAEAPAKFRSRKRRNGSWYDNDNEAKKHLRELKLLDDRGQPSFAGADGLLTYIYESHDGRYLAVQGRTGAPHVIDKKDKSFVRIWDTATGRLVLDLDEKHEIGGFSADGRTFVSTEFSTGTIHLWETATGRERLRLVGHGSGDKRIGFRPDGRVLVSGGADTQVFLWDITGRSPDGVRRETRHSPEQLRKLWQTLAGDDAAEAYRARWSLVDEPSQTVAWMREHLSLVAPVERRRLMQLIADLDSDEFAVRSKASEELARLGELAGPALRDALEAKPTLECRRRCEDLLAKLAILSSRRLRAVRAVEVLEHINTAEARALLEKWSQGAPAARQTQEARAGLERLTRRASVR